MVYMTNEEIAWCAGLFEGEGSFATMGKTGAQLVLGMTDADVVERFARLVGCGNIYVDKSKKYRKPFYRWVVTKRGDVERVTLLLLPWLGDRRAGKAVDVLERLKDNRGVGRDITHCIHGHEFTPENTTWYGPRGTYRHCLTCRRQRKRK